MLYRVRDSCRAPVSFKDMPVYFHWKTGSVEDAELGHVANKRVWIASMVEGEEGVEEVSRMLQDWELYHGKDGAGAWLVDTYTNPSLYRYLAQLGQLSPPDELRWFK